MYGSLRGLFDTDGGFYNKQKGYNRGIIDFYTNSPYIKKDIIKLLNKGNFKFSTSRYYIRVQDQKEVRKFLKLVGSANPKTIIKYNHFIEKGYIPKISDIKKYLNKIQLNDLPFKG